MILSLLAALSCLVSPALAASYSHVKAPPSMGGAVVKAKLMPGPAASLVTLSVSDTTRRYLSDAGNKITLQFKGTPPGAFHLDRMGYSRPFALIRGGESVALIPLANYQGPRTPARKRGLYENDTAAVIPVTSRNGVWPVKNVRTDKATLEKLDRALERLAANPTRTNFDRAQAVLDRHFEGSRSRLGSMLEGYDQSKLVVSAVTRGKDLELGPNAVGSVTLSVAGAPRKRTQEIDLVLRTRGKGAAKRSSIEVVTRQWADGKWKTHGGWIDESVTVRRSETSRRPALRAAASRLYRALRGARDGRSSLNDGTPRSSLLDKIESELDALRRGRK